MALGALAIAGLLYRQLRQAQADYQALLAGVEAGNLETLLHAHVDHVNQALVTVERLSRQTRELDAKVQTALQRVGIVRFNPFEDVGGDQSFAIALLDARGDGVVLSGLHTRDGVRIYAKPIEAGHSSYQLSAEEQEAIKHALG